MVRAKQHTTVMAPRFHVITRVQAGNGVYELTTTVHPGAGDAFKNICAGNGRTKGKPLKTVNWASIPKSSHPYVWGVEYGVLNWQGCCDRIDETSQFIPSALGLAICWSIVPSRLV